MYVPYHNSVIIPLQALHKAEEHMLLVTQERSAYKQEVEQSRRHVKAHFTQEGVFVSPPPHGMIAPASNAITVHYSFDLVDRLSPPVFQQLLTAVEKIEVG